MELTPRYVLPRGASVAAGLLLAVAVAFAVGLQNPAYLLVPFGIVGVGFAVLNWRSAWFLLIAFIPLSWQLDFAGGRWATSLPDEPMMAAFLGLTIILFIARRQVIPEVYWRNPIMLITAAQFLWLVIAVIFSEEHFVSVKFLLAKCWFLAALFLMPLMIVRTKKDFRLLLKLLFIPVIITTVIIFIRHAQLKFGFRTIEKAIFDIYFNHVDYSTILSMIFPVAVAAYPRTKHWKKPYRLLFLGCIIFLLPAIYLTYARAAMLALIFALVIVLAIRIKMVQWITPLFYLFIGLILAFMIHNKRYLDLYPNYDKTYSHGTFSDHMIATFKGQDMSSAERIYRWIAGIRMSTDRPLTGVGPNAFYEYYKPYAVTSFRTWVSRNEERSTTHNYFLFMLVEQGWPAMILYGILIMVLFVQAQRTYHRFRDPFWRAATLGIAGTIAASFINNFFSELIETHKVGAFWYLALALLIVLDAKSRQLKGKLDEEK